MSTQSHVPVTSTPGRNSAGGCMGTNIYIAVVGRLSDVTNVL